MNKQLFITLARKELWQHRNHVRAFSLTVLFITLLNLLVIAAKYSGYLVEVSHRHPEQTMQILQAIAETGIPVFINMTLLFLALFLAVATIHNERKDHSILFWKSLPVSDQWAVNAKMFFIAVTLPVIAWITIIVTQILTLGMQSLLFNDPLATALEFWRHLHVLPLWSNYLAILIGQMLWYFPVIAWLLLCSAWAPKGSPNAAAFGIPLLIYVIDTILKLHSGLPRMMLERTPFHAPVGFNATNLEKISDADSASISVSLSNHGDFVLLEFLQNPDLWIGMGIGVLLLFLTARIHQWRDDNA